MQLIIRSFLQSPSFISSAEVSEAAPDGSSYALDSWEMASRLSYTLWGTMPDDMLFQAAQANRLRRQADILAQAQRMVQDPRARAKMAEFHELYALQGEGTRWSEASHDPALFPQSRPRWCRSLTAEAKRFFDYITFDLQGADVPGPDDEAGRVRQQGPRADLRSVSRAVTAPT